MDFRKFFEKILIPPMGVIFICSLLSATGLITVFVNGWENEVAAVGIYVFAFYSLVILCIASYSTFPGYYKKVKGRVYENKYASRYFTDPAFKMHINLYRSLVINLIYIVVNAVSGVVYQTYWFGIFAVYYGIMAVMRFLLARYARRHQMGENRMEELKSSRFCAYILLTVNLTLSAVILMMIFFDRGFKYQGFLIYVMAMYTFYITATAIMALVKYKKYNSPIMTMNMVIKLAAALFSMLFLETAMFSQFGADTPDRVKRIMIIATGAGISVIVIVLAFYFIIKWTKEIRQIRRTFSDGK